MSNEVNKCVCCGAPAPLTWFCGCCTAAKEAAYAESRRLGETRWVDVMIRRDKALAEHRTKEHSEVEA